MESCPKPAYLYEKLSFQIIFCAAVSPYSEVYPSEQLYPAGYQNLARERLTATSSGRTPGLPIMAQGLTKSCALLAFEAPPTFLAPSLGFPLAPWAQTSRFSTSASLCLRTRDNNKNRGVSAIRRTGPKHQLSLSKEPLPQPVLDPARRSKVKVDANHGLWGFFNKDKKSLTTPEQEAAHGLFPG